MRCPVLLWPCRDGRKPCFTCSPPRLRLPWTVLLADDAAAGAGALFLPRQWQQWHRRLATTHLRFLRRQVTDAPSLVHSFVSAPRLDGNALLRCLQARCERQQARSSAVHSSSYMTTRHFPLLRDTPLLFLCVSIELRVMLHVQKSAAFLSLKCHFASPK